MNGGFQLVDTREISISDAPISMHNFAAWPLTRHSEKKHMAYLEVPARGQPSGRVVFGQHSNKVTTAAYRTTVDV
jgi:hypothetical protein